MGVLSNREMLVALDDGRLRIDPRPAPGLSAINSPFNTSSVDLRLASDLQIASCTKPETSHATGGVAETLGARLRFCTSSRSRASCSRRSGSCWAARSRASACRCPGSSRDGSRGGAPSRAPGFSFTSRRTIHAGFAGTIALEIINLGPLALVLRPGLRICQLVVETVEGEPIGKLSQFQGQGRPSGSR
jgi:dCTP deaminase